MSKNNNSQLKEINFLGKKIEIYNLLYNGILSIDNDTCFTVAFDKLKFFEYFTLLIEKKENIEYHKKISEKFNLKLNEKNKIECICKKSHLLYLNIFKHSKSSHNYVIGSTCIDKVEKILYIIESNLEKYENKLLASNIEKSIEKIRKRIKQMKDYINEIKSKKCLLCNTKLPKKSKYNIRKFICKKCYKNDNINENNLKKILKLIKDNKFNCICKECYINFSNLELLDIKPDLCSKECKQINENKQKGIYNLICEDCNETYKNTRPFKTTKCFQCYIENVQNNTSEKIYLNVPYSHKDKVKSKGGKWDRDKKKWYIFEDNKYIDEIISEFEDE
jgi:hypothetical protein